MKSDHYNGGIQKGTRVLWNKDRKSGKGVVTKVHGTPGGHYTPENPTEWDVKDDATGITVRVNYRQIKFENIPNRKRKQAYATKHGL